MEQKTVLAIVLSLLILIGYNSLFIKKNSPSDQPLNAINISQHIDNNNVVDVKDRVSLPEIKPATPSQEVVDLSQIIENNELKTNFTNIGGNLKSVYLKKYHHTLPITSMGSVTNYENVDYQNELNQSGKIVYKYSDNNIEIYKTYTLVNDHKIDVDLKIINKSLTSNLKDLTISPFKIDSSNLNEKEFNVADRSLFEYSISFPDRVFRKGNAHTFSDKDKNSQYGAINWVAFRDKFFCFIIKPEFSANLAIIEPNLTKNLRINIPLKNLNLDPGKEIDYKFTSYFGMQNEQILKEYNNGFENVISFSNFSIIDFISKNVTRAMVFMHNLIPSWGICILIICTAIYWIMYPLTLNGMKSMRKMQVLQPKMAQLREQHKNNPQKLNKEIMELYKEHGVNPLGGCFPFILQMPVFIGLYQALWRSPYFFGSSFLWIKDLAYPDRLFIFPFNLPVIGNEFNLLPILMMIVMFFQQKLSSKNIVNTDPAQIAQQKMMATIFPIMLGFIFYKFASALTLYFTAFYMFSTITQWKMSKIIIK